MENSNYFFIDNGSDMIKAGIFSSNINTDYDFFAFPSFAMNLMKPGEVLSFQKEKFERSLLNYLKKYDDDSLPLKDPQPFSPFNNPIFKKGTL